ncbi:MAG: HD domain-containing protein, partial [Lachnospiraceae bacterium]|nr:HD domain-containing protein [Candidatus Equihabitans merdae]
MEQVTTENASGRILDYNLKAELEHGIYVSLLAAATATDMNLPEEEVKTITLAGLVHDVGKLRLKVDMEADDEHRRFITEELKHVRGHARQSYEWLKDRGFPEEVLEIVMNHHENYDGSGYPNKLVGEMIPLGARVIRVCDVFAALTSDR